MTILRGHAGRWIEEQLAERGVRLRAAWAPGETRTCISIRDPQIEGLTEIYDRGEPLAPSDWEALEALVAEELAAGAELLTISGGIPPGVDDDAFRRLCRVARESGVRALVDVYGPGLVSVLGDRPWLAKMNDTEAVGPARTAGRDRKPGDRGGCRDPSPWRGSFHRDDGAIRRSRVDAR